MRLKWQRTNHMTMMCCWCCCDTQVLDWLTPFPFNLRCSLRCNLLSLLDIPLLSSLFFFLRLLERFILPVGSEIPLLLAEVAVLAPFKNPCSALTVDESNIVATIDTAKSLITKRDDLIFTFLSIVCFLDFIVLELFLMLSVFVWTHFALTLPMYFELVEIVFLFVLLCGLGNNKNEMRVKCKCLWGVAMRFWMVFTPNSWKMSISSFQLEMASMKLFTQTDKLCERNITEFLLYTDQRRPHGDAV